MVTKPHTERTVYDERNEVGELVEDETRETNLHEVDYLFKDAAASHVWKYVVRGEEEGAQIRRVRTVGGDTYAVIHAFDIHDRTKTVAGSTMKVRTESFIEAKTEFRNLLQQIAGDDNGSS